MSIVKLPYKDFIKSIAICLFIIIAAFATYYFTKGSLFDGVLLTFFGISSTFLIIVLSVLIFKLLTNVFVKESYRILGLLLSFFLTLSFIYYVFITLFKLVSKEI